MSGYSSAWDQIRNFSKPSKRICDGLNAMYHDCFKSSIVRADGKYYKATSGTRWKRDGYFSKKRKHKLGEDDE